MTGILHTADEGLTETLEEQFLDLVWSDEEWLRAEFEAIIEAEWPTPPPVRPVPAGPGPQPPTPRGRHWSDAPPGRLASRPRHPGIGGWARQRSPPTRTGRPAAHEALPRPPR